MKSSELVKCISEFPYLNTFFAGIYAKDNIPKKLKHNNFIIVNTDFLNGPGIHWYCLLKINDCIECFDSLGVDSDKKSFLFSLPIVKKSTELDLNTTPLQLPNSSTCGGFVLYFLINRYHNLDMNYDDLLNDLFEVRAEVNESKVKSFLQNHLENYIHDGSL